ncbi:MAG: relaxase/mobilization nuclease domain-containing protein [Clostridia bacterium]|nr:relaxase/mobilization nuclease domain-containing protein [Clostridia bacterium]
MAIEKDIAIKVKGGASGELGVDRMIDYITDDHHSGEKVSMVINYDINPDKTTFANGEQPTDERLNSNFINKNVLVSSISGGEMSRRLDAIDFMRDKDHYKKIKAGDQRGMGLVNKGKAQERDAYHVIQSFNESCDELDPRLAHQLGVEYAKKAFPGYKVIVSTHINTGHVHNHIAVCAYSEDGTHKLNFDKTFRRQIREINDDICIQYGLHTLDPDLIYNKKNSRYVEKLINERKNLSMKDQIKLDLANILIEHGSEFKTWQDYTDYLKSHGFEVNEGGKYVTYSKRDLLMKNGEPFKVRDNKLGEEFSREFICKHFSDFEQAIEGKDIFTDKNKRALSWKEQVRADLRIAFQLHGSEFGSWDGFVKYMEKQDYEIHQTPKSVTYINHNLIMKNGEPFKVKDINLDETYTRRFICEKLHWNTWKMIDDAGNTHWEAEEYKSERQARIKAYNERKRLSYEQNREYSNIFDNNGNLSFNRNIGRTTEKFFISRYTPDGRRRTDIELVILAVIQIVKWIRNLFKNKEKHIEDGQAISAKAGLDKYEKELENTLFYARKHGVNDIDGLLNMHKELERTLIDLTSELNFYERRADQDQTTQQICSKLAQIAGSLAKVGIILTEDFLMVHKPTETELRAFTTEKENSYEISGRQSQKLYKLLNQKDQHYQLKGSFADLTFADADAAIRFLSGVSDKKPDVLASPEEQIANKREKLYQKIFEKLEESKRSEKLSVPILGSLIKQLMPFITENGIEIDLSKLTQGQGYGLLQHFKDIPLTDDKTIRKDQIDALNRRLEKSEFKLNKPTEYVLKSEYEPIKTYLESKKGPIPDALKEYKALTFSTKKQISELLEMTGKSLVIPIEYISEEQGRILVSDLLYHHFKPEALLKDKTPEQIRTINKDLEPEFIKSIAQYPQDVQDLLIEARSHQLKLYEAGEDINSDFKLGSAFIKDKHIADALRIKIDEIKADFNNVDSLVEAYGQVQQIFHNTDLSAMLNFENAPEQTQTAAPTIEAEYIEPAEKIVEKIENNVSMEDVLFPMREGHTYWAQIYTNWDYASQPIEEQTALRNVLYNAGAFENGIGFDDLRDIMENITGVRAVHNQMFKYVGGMAVEGSVKDTLDKNLDYNPIEVAAIHEDENPVPVAVFGKEKSKYVPLNIYEFYNPNLKNQIEAFNEQHKDQLTTDFALIPKNKQTAPVIEPEIPPKYDYSDPEPEEKKLKGWAAYNKKHGLDADIGY